MAKKILKWTGMVLAAICGLWILVLVALEIGVSSNTLRNKVVELSADYIDADLALSSVKMKAFSAFPDISLELRDVSVTYPHERYAQWDDEGMGSRMRLAGRGSEGTDTLLSASKLYVKASYLPLLMGRIRIKDIQAKHFRLYAHSYSDTLANWNIFKAGADDDPQEEDSALPRLVFKHISIDGRPRIVYTSVADTVFASIGMKSMLFRGRLDSGNNRRWKLHFDMDSLFAAGRLPKDTLLLALDHFGMHGIKDYHLDARLRTFMALGGRGRISLPLELDADLSFPEKDFSAIKLSGLSFGTKNIRLDADLLARFSEDSTYIKADAGIDSWELGKSLDYLSGTILPELGDFSTNAKISAKAACDGWLGENRLPAFKLDLSLPDAWIAYSGLQERGHIAAGFTAFCEDGSSVFARLRDMDIDFAGLSAKGDIRAGDLLAPDPGISLNLKAGLDLEKMGSLLPEWLHAEGSARMEASGDILLSQLDMEKIFDAKLQGWLQSEAITVRDEADSIYAEIGKTDIRLGSDKAKGLELKAMIDKFNAELGSSTYIRGNRLSLNAGGGKEKNGIRPLDASLEAGRIVMRGEDSLRVGLTGSRNKLSVTTGKKGLGSVAVSSDNRGIFLRQGANRIGLRGVGFDAAASIRNRRADRGRRKAALDSMKRLHPGLSKDSLLAIMRAGHSGRLPDYLKEKDFRDRDLDIRLGDEMAKLLRQWDLRGGLQIDSAIVISPAFPLRNTLTEMRGNFTTDGIELDNLTIRSGESDLSAIGSISGLRRAMLRGGGVINLDLGITSNYINANELLSAYSIGQQNTVAVDDGEMSDEQYMESIVAGSSDADSSYSLVVLPANIVARITLNGERIHYSDLDIDWIATDIRLRERCLQITNTLATSNMGDIYFDGFYSTRNKQDISTGFDLNLVNITADKVIKLIPQVDSIMPLLKNFQGNLDCELAVTSRLDTNMNIITPSISGIARIQGSDLALREMGPFKKIARLLLFKDKKVGRIDDMVIEGILGENNLEVFPFILGVDRYKLGLSGVQSFDQSFKYHVSVMKSPIPFKFGINLSGNFDNWKYRLGGARYKSSRVPVYSARIDTLQMNLSKSIQDIFNKGVEVALEQNRAESIRMAAESEAIYADSDSLSSSELAHIDSLLYNYDNPVDSLANADSLNSASPNDPAFAEASPAKSSAKRKCWLKSLFHKKEKEAIKDE